MHPIRVFYYAKYYGIAGTGLYHLLPPTKVARVKKPQPPHRRQSLLSLFKRD
jgi:hypothetical protein